MPSVIEYFEVQPTPQPWGDELLVARIPLYEGRRLRYNPKAVHEAQTNGNDKASYLYRGEGWMEYVGLAGDFHKIPLAPGMSFRHPPGSAYRFGADTECIVFEVSGPGLKPEGFPYLQVSPEPFVPTVKQQSWGEEILVAKGEAITGKLLQRYTTGSRGGLQYHPHRDETFYLYGGEALVYFVDEEDQVRSYHMRPGESFHIPQTAIHSVQTLTDSVMFEASHLIPDHLPPRARVEEQYDVSKAVKWP